jgi:cytochrome c peroxidase
MRSGRSARESAAFKMHKLALAVLAGLIAAATGPARADDLMQRAQQTFKPIPASVPAVKGNVITKDRIELGKMLYFDPRLSASQVISCNSCHDLAGGGVDAGPTSIGHSWQKGPRRAPTVFNAVFNIAQFWDGRAADLKTQAKGPLQNPVEMDSEPARVERTLRSIPEYVERFGKAFPGESSPVSFDNATKAIEAFEATLITPGARFDRFLAGDAHALSDQEKRGLGLFMDKGCSGCHNGINVGGGAYFTFGLVQSPGDRIRPVNDKGRLAVTKDDSDEYVFRVAPLRNVALRAPYFHSGQVWTLKEAVGVMGKVQLGLDLSEQQKDDIVAFLNTLSGQRPSISLPVLPARTESTPLPFQAQGTPPPAGLPTITVIGHRSTATGGPVDSGGVAARG